MNNVILRQVLLRATYAVFAIPVGVAIALAAAWTYGLIFEIGHDAKVDEIGLGHVFAGFVVLMIGFLLGMIAGGTLWSRVAKYIFRFTKAEFEEFLIAPNSPQFLNRKNQRAIDKLFGGTNAG